MKKKQHMQKFAVHSFETRDSINFCPKDYSILKHGSGSIAKKYGEELAVKFFENYSHIIVNEQLVVMESAYSYVHNAASVMTQHFTNKLNCLLSELNGKNVYRLKINRIVPYIADYGKLSAKKRVKLLKQDTFTFDADFAKDKYLIFIDDIYITGTHHRKIEEMLLHYGIDMDKAISLYYGELTNPAEDPAIESYLNNAHVVTLKDLATLIGVENDYKVIVRTLKMVLGEKNVAAVNEFISDLSDEMVGKFYHQCLGEGYHRNPAYSTNFAVLRNKFLETNK